MSCIIHTCLDGRFAQAAIQCKIAGKLGQDCPVDVSKFETIWEDTNAKYLRMMPVMPLVALLPCTLFSTLTGMPPSHIRTRYPAVPQLDIVYHVLRHACRLTYKS